MAGEERFNPFSEAIENAKAGVAGVLKRTPLPSSIEDQVAEYDRRMNDPAALPELIAIYERHQLGGLLDYVANMEKLKRAWGL